MATVNKRYFIENKELATKEYAESAFTAARTYTDNAIADIDMQYETMPVASENTLGKVIQYIGETTPLYTQGYFYLGTAEEVSGIVSYSWKEIGTQEVDLSNYLAKNNTTAFTPTGDYNPSTKKYVDDTVAAAENYYLFCTNSDALFKFSVSDNQQELVKIMNSVYEPNVDYYTTSKKYYSNIRLITGDNETAPIKMFQFYKNSSAGTLTVYLSFGPVVGRSGQGSYSPTTQVYTYVGYTVYLKIENNIVTGVYSNSALTQQGVINSTRGVNTSMYDGNRQFIPTNNTTSYTPTSDYHPATKKYVDDAVSASLNRLVVPVLPTQDISEKTIYMVPKTPGGRLPAEYQEVTYIESHGTEYINTGVEANSDIKTEVVLLNPNMNDSVDHTLCGGGDTWGSNYIQIQCRLNSMCSYGDSWARVPFTGGNRITIVQDKNKFYQDGTLLSTFNTDTFTTSYPIYLFCAAQSGTPAEFSSFKVESFKLYNDDVLVRDLVPCYRRSDDEPGLYDLVNDVFYTNLGTGDFAIGDPVIGSLSSVGNDVYNEYMYINNAWELIGSTDIDLSDYATKEYVEEHTTQQVETMPEASADNAGSIIQYTGDDESGLEQGHFYICVEEEVSGISTYHWEEINVQDAPDLSNYYTKTEVDNKVIPTLTEDTILTKYGVYYVDTDIYRGIRVTGISTGNYYTISLFGEGTLIYTGNKHHSNVQWADVFFYFCTAFHAPMIYYWNDATRKEFKLNNYLPKDNTTSYTPSGDYNPATKKYVDDTKAVLETEIDTASIQKDEMPIASAENIGEIIQYIGDTTGGYEQGHFYICKEEEVSGVVTYNWEEINVQQPGGQAEVMPEPGADNVGQIIQYTGEDSEELEQGHFYICVEGEEVSGVVTYVWQEVTVQGKNVDASDPEAVSELINGIGTGETSTIYVENFGPNGDYDGYVVVTPTGENAFDYSYQTSDGEVINGSATITTDPVSGDPVINYGTETVVAVHQARGWHLNQDISNIHAFYEDAQWILNEWTAQDTYITPNFQVDGYNLTYFAQYTSSIANDYKRYRMVFTKLVDASNYYYEVYFYAHYNNTTIYNETSNYKANKNGRYSYAFLTSHQSLSNYLAKNNTTSFTPTGDYNPATKKYVDDTATELEEAIEEASIQLDELPEPSSSNVGEVYQYTGPDTQDLDHGHFYEIVEVEVSGVTTYEYQDIGITVGVTTAVVPQEITDITYGAYRRYPGYSDTGLQLLQNNNGQLIWGQTVNSIWIGTQQEYDDLPEHFDTMIYFIKEDE